MRYDEITPKNKNTREFQRWFGNSKVVDKSGNPLVLFHGTSNEFDGFHEGMVWGTVDTKMAQEYSNNGGFTKEGMNIIPLYFRIENPFNADVLPKRCTIEQFVKAIAKQGKPIVRSLLKKHYKAIKDGANFAGYSDKSEFNTHSFWHYPYMDFTGKGEEAIFDLMKTLGFDGIYFTERGVETWGAFNNNQVKSIWNNGSWGDSSYISEAIASRPYHLKTFVEGRIKTLTSILQTVKDARDRIETNQDGADLLRAFLTYGSNHDDAADEIDYMIYLASERGFERNIPLDNLRQNLSNYRQYGMSFLKYVLSTFDHHEPSAGKIEALGRILMTAERGAEKYGYDATNVDDEYRTAMGLRDGLVEFTRAVLNGLRLWGVVKSKLGEVSKIDYQYRPEHGEVETVYHASAFASEIAEKGFAAEKPVGRRGLGNFGNQQTISFTHNLKIAQDIMRGLKEVWMIAHGRLTAREISEWIENEKLDKQKIEQTVGLSVEEPSNNPLFTSKRRLKRLHEITTPEETVKLYRIWLSFTKLRADPCFVYIEDTLEIMKTRKISDIGILECEVELTKNDEYLVSEWEFRLHANRVRSVKRLL